MAKAQTTSSSVTVTKTKRSANIIMFVVIGLAALILIAVAVLSAVRVNPMEKFDEPESYEFYDAGSSTRLCSAIGEEKSEIRVALSGMDFSVMSAILQGRWDYSFNFMRNADGDKEEISGAEAYLKSPDEGKYMIELVYPSVVNDRGELDLTTAQSIEVDGETVYFDRLKVIIGNSDGEIGTIELYPYIDARSVNTSTNPEFSAITYKVTGITIRANTTETYARLAEYASSFKH